MISCKYSQWFELIWEEITGSLSGAEKEKLQCMLSEKKLLQFLKDSKVSGEDVFLFLKATPKQREQKKSWSSKPEKLLALKYFSLLYLKVGKEYFEVLQQTPENGGYRDVTAELCRVAIDFRMKGLPVIKFDDFS